jgi:hypothetical protein
VSAALKGRPFLDTVRELIGEEVPRPPASVVTAVPEVDPRQALVQLGVQFLETLASMLGGAAVAPAETNGQQAALLVLIGTNARPGRPVLQLPLPAPAGVAAWRQRVAVDAEELHDLPQPCHDLGIDLVGGDADEGGGEVRQERLKPRALLKRRGKPALSFVRNLVAYRGRRWKPQWMGRSGSSQIGGGITPLRGLLRSLDS